MTLVLVLVVVSVTALFCLGTLYAAESKETLDNLHDACMNELHTAMDEQNVLLTKTWTNRDVALFLEDADTAHHALTNLLTKGITPEHLLTMFLSSETAVAGYVSVHIESDGPHISSYFIAGGHPHTRYSYTDHKENDDEKVIYSTSTTAETRAHPLIARFSNLAEKMFAADAALSYHVGETVGTGVDFGWKGMGSITLVKFNETFYQAAVTAMAYEYLADLMIRMGTATEGVVDDYKFLYLLNGVSDGKPMEAPHPDNLLLAATSELHSTKHTLDKTLECLLCFEVSRELFIQYLSLKYVANYSRAEVTAAVDSLHFDGLYLEEEEHGHEDEDEEEGHTDKHEDEHAPEPEEGHGEEHTEGHEEEHEGEEHVWDADTTLEDVVHAEVNSDFVSRFYADIGGPVVLRLPSAILESMRPVDAHSGHEYAAMLSKEVVNEEVHTGHEEEGHTEGHEEGGHDDHDDEGHDENETQAIDHEYFFVDLKKAHSERWGRDFWVVHVRPVSAAAVKSAEETEHLEVLDRRFESLKDHQHELATTNMVQSLVAVTCIIVVAVLLSFLCSKLIIIPLQELETSVVFALKMEVDTVNLDELAAQRSYCFTEVEQLRQLFSELMELIRESKQYLPQAFLEQVDGGSEAAFSDHYPHALEDDEDDEDHIEDSTVPSTVPPTGARSEGSRSQPCLSFAQSSVSMQSGGTSPHGSQRKPGSFVNSLGTPDELAPADSLLTTPSLARGESSRSGHTASTEGLKRPSDNENPSFRANHANHAKRNRSPNGFILSKKQVSQVTLGVRDFSEYIKRLAEAVLIVDFHSTWMLCCTTDAKDFGGNLERFVGDCLEVNFGGLTSCIQPSLKASKYALRVRERCIANSLDSYSETEPCIGIATGPALVGTLGGVGIKSPAVLGRTIQISHAMQTISREIGLDIISDARHADELRGSFSLLPVDYVKFSETGKKHFVYYVANQEVNKGDEWMYSFKDAGEFEQIVMGLKNLGTEHETLQSLIEMLSTCEGRVAHLVSLRWKAYFDEVVTTTGRAPSEYCRLCRWKPATVPMYTSKSVATGSQLSRSSPLDLGVIINDSFPRAVSIGSSLGKSTPSSTNSLLSPSARKPPTYRASAAKSAASTDEERSMGDSGIKLEV